MSSLIDTFISNCKSWDDFASKINSLSDNVFKGHLFERLTQLYLLNTSIYSSKLINVWWCNNKGELPANIQKKLNLPNDDEGIDLVCETVDGEFWSIQSKYKANQDKALTRKELATFEALSFNTCKNISLAIVVHTSNKPIKKSKLMTNVTEIGLDKWLEISEDDWERLRKYCQSNRLLPPQKRNPRKHQKAAINDALNYFSQTNNSRGKLIMPCGTGKSLTAFWIAQALNAKNIIVSVPSLALIRQGIADWTAEYLANGIKPDWIAICADDSVGKTSDADSTVASIYDTGIPTTTNVNKIECFLKKKTKLPKIIFTTYQSGLKLCEAAKKNKYQFDLLICDEAHKTVGVSNSFSILLFDKNISVKKRIFMTATERILKITSGSKEDIVSMDNLDNYGEIFYHLSFKEAIKQKIICDYKIITLAVTKKDAISLIEENPALKVSIGKNKIETDAHNISVGIALQRVFEKYKIRHAVTFHSSIKRSLFFSSQQKEYLKQTGIENFHVSSQNSAGQRADILRNFANENKAIISNAKCLTEGVDIPSIDCVVFADPKQSVVDIVQAAGRAMRQSKKTGKKNGYILLPIIVPDDENLSDFSESTNFKQIVRIIASLSTQDERIADELKQGVKKRSVVPTNIIQIDTNLHEYLNISSTDLFETIYTQIWSNVARANWLPYLDAKNIVQKYGFKHSEDYRKKSRNYPDLFNIPINADRYYQGSGWTSWGDFLGTGFVANYLRKWRDFEKAKKFAHSLNLNSGREWNELADKKKLPDDLPYNPDQVYRGLGWKNWPDFIGTNNRRVLFNYDQAKKIAQTYNITKQEQWVVGIKNNKLPKGLPVAPQQAYKKEWTGWLAFLNKERSFLDFKEAQRIISKMEIKSEGAWRSLVKEGKIPSNIPTNPNSFYKKEWINWPHWLRNERIIKKFNYDEASDFCKKAGLKRQVDFHKLKNTKDFPKEMPKEPNKVFKDNGWVDWPTFLQSSIIPIHLRKIDNIQEAKKFVKKNKIKSSVEWTRFVIEGKIPDNLPLKPDFYYRKNGWKGWNDFTETEKINYDLTYLQARKIVRALKLKSSKEWEDYSNSRNKHPKIPKHPRLKYLNKGWKDMYDWLGISKVMITATYLEASEWAKTNNVNSQKDWLELVRLKKIPEHFPKSPNDYYLKKGEWKGWVSFLGKNQKIFRSFKDAKKYARSLKLRSSNEWKKYGKENKLPNDIPSSPQGVYLFKGWKGWHDFLGKKK